MARERILIQMLIINDELHVMLQQLLDYQKQLASELDDSYVDGFHDGMELVIAAIEQRHPILTQINKGEVLM